MAESDNPVFTLMSPAGRHIHIFADGRVAGAGEYSIINNGIPCLLAEASGGLEGALRDYFATHAPDHVTRAAIADLTVSQIRILIGKETYSDAERLAARYALIAEACYGFADAMLAVRAKGR